MMGRILLLCLLGCFRRIHHSKSRWYRVPQQGRILRGLVSFGRSLAKFHSCTRRGRRLGQRLFVTIEGSTYYQIRSRCDCCSKPSTLCLGCMGRCLRMIVGLFRRVHLRCLGILVVLVRTRWCSRNTCRSCLLPILLRSMHLLRNMLFLVLLSSHSYPIRIGCTWPCRFGIL